MPLCLVTQQKKRTTHLRTQDSPDILSGRKQELQPIGHIFIELQPGVKGVIRATPSSGRGPHSNTGQTQAGPQTCRACALPLQLSPWSAKAPFIVSVELNCVELQIIPR